MATLRLCGMFSVFIDSKENHFGIERDEPYTSNEEKLNEYSVSTHTVCQ